ncbi:hypothetical protein [Microbispora rosea]
MAANLLLHFTTPTKRWLMAAIVVVCTVGTGFIGWKIQTQADQQSASITEPSSSLAKGCASLKRAAREEAEALGDLKASIRTTGNRTVGTKPDFTSRYATAADAVKKARSAVGAFLSPPHSPSDETIVEFSRDVKQLDDIDLDNMHGSLSEGKNAYDEWNQLKVYVDHATAIADDLACPTT